MGDRVAVFTVRGEMYRKLGEYGSAINSYNQALKLKSDFATALRSKSWTMATAKDAYYRDGKEALRLAKAAAQLDDSPSHRDTLAAAYAEAGEFDDAVAEQQRAIQMLRQAGEYDEIPDYETRLELYENRQPYRE